MSSDNGLYVLQTKDGWRVKHLQAVENLWWSKGEQLDNLNPVAVYLAFESCIEFTDKKDAFTFAFDWAEDFPILEYGVSELPLDFSEITFEELKQKAVEFAKEEIKYYQKDQKKREQKDLWKYEIDERKHLIKQDKIRKEFTELLKK